nr:MAG TPA: glycoside hydrolase family protein [Caudoviricetes sp.]
MKNNLVYFGPGIYRRKTKVNCFLKTSEKKMT